MHTHARTHESTHESTHTHAHAHTHACTHARAHAHMAHTLGSHESLAQKPWRQGWRRSCDCRVSSMQTSSAISSSIRSWHATPRTHSRYAHTSTHITHAHVPSRMRACMHTHTCTHTQTWQDRSEEHGQMRLIMDILTANPQVICHDNYYTSNMP